VSSPWAAPTDVAEFTEAASWLLGRVPVTKQTWTFLDENAQRKAFTVAGVAKADVIRDVLLSLDRAVANGETLEDFKKRVGQQLVDAWAGSVINPAWRVETIFRTNAQLAYNAGRHRQMTEPAILKVRPYWRFDAILDNRVTRGCELADGTTLPHEHPWWGSNYPPRHFNCRSVVRSIRKKQAEREGITQTPPTELAQDGFGALPDEAEWAPDTKRYPAEIRKELEARLGRLKDRELIPTPQPPKPKAKTKAPPKPKAEHTVEHWEKQFKPKYGDAARAMAWGRAMQERGLDLTAERAAELAKKHGFLEFDELAKTYPGKLLRDLPLGDMKNPIAAILGHLNNIDSKTGTAKITKIIGKGAAKDLERAKKWYDAFLTKGIDGRAEMMWVWDRAKCVVSVTPPRIQAYDFRSIVHEWGHAIEAMNGKVADSATAFLAARTKGEAAQSLNKLMGRTDLKPWEIARPDKFFSPYCGKVYAPGVTELLSMGAEKVAEDPFWFYSRDAEHFWWVLGCLGGYA